jgi:hypothetical protein
MSEFQHAEPQDVNPVDVPVEQPPEQPAAPLEPADFAANELAAAQIVAQIEHTTFRNVKRYVLPLFAAKMAFFGAFVYFEAQEDNRPTPSPYSCADFSADVIQPVDPGAFIAEKPGARLKPTDISTAGMTKIGVLEADDGSYTDVRTKPMGKIRNDGTTLKGNLSGPDAYTSAVVKVLSDEEIRWGVCSLAGGLTAEATDNADYVNGEFVPSEHRANFIFSASNTGDHLYQDQRDVKYVAVHELGHSLRNRILRDSANPEAIALVKELDELYVEQLKMGVEEYRQGHHAEIAANLDTLLAQMNAVDESVIDASSKAQLNELFSFVKQRLTQENGLADLAVYQDPGDASVNDDPEASLAAMEDMLSNASAILTPESPFLGLSEFFQDTPTLDKKLLTGIDDALREYLDGAFMTEHILPGNEGGHARKSSNELFATNWLLTHYVGEGNFDKILAKVPEAHRDVVGRQLQAMLQIRRTVNPLTLVK